VSRLLRKCNAMQRHTPSVYSVLFSPDGTHIITGSDDKTVQLWDAGTGEPVGEHSQGHTDSVRSVSFLADGTCIISGSWDNTVWLWDAGTGEPVSEPLQGHTSSVNPVLFSPDGTHIVTSLSDKTVWLWNAVMTTDEAAIATVRCVRSFSILR
jgi:WD40 repeat protein